MHMIGKNVLGTGRDQFQLLTQHLPGESPENNLSHVRYPCLDSKWIPPDYKTETLSLGSTMLEPHKKCINLGSDYQGQ
jgi:hypothetical protein